MIAEHPKTLFAPVLGRLAADLSRQYGQGAGVEPVSYEERPFSHLLKLRCRYGPAAERSIDLFLKLTKPTAMNGDMTQLRERVQHDFDVTRLVHERMTGSDALAAVRPIACYPEYLAMVTEESRGVTLLALLEDQGRWFPGRRRLLDLCRILARVGQWIREFQRMAAPGPIESVGELRDYIDLRLTRLRALDTANFTERDRENVLRHIDALGRSAGPDAPRQVPIHGDMALGNILVCGDRIVLLDFAMAKSGHPLLDLTRAFVQLELLRAKPQFRSSTVTALQEALIAGFDAAVRPDQPSFRLMVLLHRINHLTTLSVNRYAWIEQIYNYRVKALHRAWLARELASPADEDLS